MSISLRRTLLSGLAACAAGVLAQTSASAQAGEDTVARCRSLSTDAARIACLEQAVMGAPPATPAAAAPATAAPPAADPLERRGLRLPGIPFIGGADEEAEDRIVASDSPEADEFGAQMVAVRTGEFEPISRLNASVTEARQVGYKQLEVVLDNGQVWRQIASDQPWDSRRYDEPEQVEIWASRLGGYRLRIPNTQVTLRVERVQ